MSNLEVPKIGEDNLNRVTQSSEPFVFNKSASEQHTQHPYQHCPKPGEPVPSVDNTEEAGVDCTRELDWKVIESEVSPNTRTQNKFTMTNIGMKEAWIER